MSKITLIDGKYHHAPGRIKKASRRQGAIPQKREFSAGIIDRLSASFTGSQVPINEEIKHGLRTMRARARDLCSNNDYARRFVQMVKSNVIGVNGIKLQAQTMRGVNKPDMVDNQLIESAWKIWGRPFNCSIDSKLSWRDIENLAIASIARDGEVLIQIIETPLQGFGMRLRVLPAEYLDENHNGELPNGNQVVMGIEYDTFGAIVAYHIRQNNVKAWVNVYPEREYLRIDAADILHLHIVDFPEQARGIPWMHSAIKRLNMVGKYEEAELVAASIGASKMGFYHSADGDSYTPDEIVDGEEDDDGELIMQMEAGTIEQLPSGTTFTGFDPTHPTTAFDGFMRAVLRGASSGLNVSYSGLSNDLENVNFSSIRAGVLDERDQWRVIQSWLIEHMHQRIYERWLPTAIINGKLPLPFKKVATKYQNIRWQPRGWPWVDPKKDSEANRNNIGMGIETRQGILSQQGRDFDETLEQLAYEKQRADALGVNIDFWLEEENPFGAKDDDE